MLIAWIIIAAAVGSMTTQAMGWLVFGCLCGLEWLIRRMFPSKVIRKNGVTTKVFDDDDDDWD